MKESSDIKKLLASLGLELKDQRELLGYSQEKLAERSGLHRTYITDIEGGHRNITLKSISRLAEALEIPLADLFLKIEKRSEPISKAVQPIFSPFDILLVEDNPSHVELTLNAIERNGVTNPIFVTRTAEETLDYLFAQGKFSSREKAGNPKLILLDLTLPGMSGIEFLKETRKHEKTRSIPIVILTSSRSDQDYKACVELGVKAFISKPIDFMEFSMIVPTLGFRWQLTEHAAV